MRIAAAIVLARLGPPAQAAIPALIRAIRVPTTRDVAPGAESRANELRSDWPLQLPRVPLSSGRKNGLRAEQQYWTIEALGRLAPGSRDGRESPWRSCSRS